MCEVRPIVVTSVRSIQDKMSFLEIKAARGGVTHTFNLSTPDGNRDGAQRQTFVSSRPAWSEEFPGLSGLLHREPCFEKPKGKKKIFVCLWELETWLFERTWVQFLAPM